MAESSTSKRHRPEETPTTLDRLLHLHYQCDQWLEHGMPAVINSLGFCTPIEWNSSRHFINFALTDILHTHTETNPLRCMATRVYLLTADRSLFPSPMSFRLAVAQFANASIQLAPTEASEYVALFGRLNDACRVLFTDIIPPHSFDGFWKTTFVLLTHLDAVVVPCAISTPVATASRLDHSIEIIGTTPSFRSYRGIEPYAVNFAPPPLGALLQDRPAPIVVDCSSTASTPVATRSPTPQPPQAMPTSAPSTVTRPPLPRTTLKLPSWSHASRVQLPLRFPPARK